VAASLAEPGLLAGLLAVAQEAPAPAGALPWCTSPQVDLDTTLLELLAAAMNRAMPGLSEAAALLGSPSAAPPTDPQWGQRMAGVVVQHPGTLALVERALERCLKVGCAAANVPLPCALLQRAVQGGTPPGSSAVGLGP
jgi:hypothetical protein